MRGRDYSFLELKRLVTRQMGRVPAISFRVAGECDFGWPAVISNDPVKPGGEPNPNLYYLVCPWMRRELARLEDSGFIETLEGQLAGDKNLVADTLRAQLKHTDEFRQAMASIGTGLSGHRNLIAGSREPLKLKCMHAHMAYYLVHRDYQVGERIAAAIERLWCPDERCSTWMSEIIDDNRSI